MDRTADLSQFGMAALVGQFLSALDLESVVLVLNDWGGGQFLLTERLPGHERVAGLALIACEAFDNFPPPPARPIAALARIPGGAWLFVQAMRVGALRRAQLGYGGMSEAGVPDRMIRDWFAPAQGDARIRHDLAAFASGAPERETLLDAAGRLADVTIPTLVMWASDDPLMPAEHGSRLAESIPNTRLVIAHQSRTLVPLDQPELVATHLDELVSQVVRGIS